MIFLIQEEDNKLQARRVEMKIKFKNTEEFKKLLMIKGYSQRTFAEATNISNPHLNLIINGERYPSGKLAKKIVDQLELNFEDIFFIDVACNEQAKIGGTNERTV